jgi:hypothetical protein
MEQRTNGLLMNVSAFIRGRVVPHLYSTGRRVGALPKKAGLEQESLEARGSSRYTLSAMDVTNALL